MDTLFIRDLEVSAIIGGDSWERLVKQTLVFDVEMTADVSKAASTDNLEDALDNIEVANSIQKFVGDSEFQLVETVAERVAELILTEFDITWLRLKLTKPRPLSGELAVGVTIE
jgi:7,8-dihydroneopterin aldolase/epimerase/oxygenase